MKRIIMFFAVVLLSFSCDKLDVQPLPYVSFDVTLMGPQYYSLGGGEAIGVSNSNLLFNGGVEYAGYDDNGFILYNYFNQEFYAMDRTCVRDLSDHNSKLTIDGDKAKCPKCSAVYLLQHRGQTEDFKGRLQNYGVRINHSNRTVGIYN